MPPPDILPQLVERFEQNRDHYRQGKYNETQLRRGFLDPFFEALGWDVPNKQCYAELYKDVVHEDSLAVEGGSKAPDYAFRIGGIRKFFVEAKNPHQVVAGTGLAGACPRRAFIHCSEDCPARSTVRRNSHPKESGTSG